MARWWLERWISPLKTKSKRRTKQFVRRFSNMRAAVDRCPPIFVNQISYMQLLLTNWHSIFVC
jgi:hypothetical protein